MITGAMPLYQSNSGLNDAEVVQTAEVPIVTANSHHPGPECGAVTSEADIVGQLDTTEVGSTINRCVL